MGQGVEGGLRGYRHASAFMQVLSSSVISVNRNRLVDLAICGYTEASQLRPSPRAFLSRACGSRNRRCEEGSLRSWQPSFGDLQRKTPRGELRAPSAPAGRLPAPVASSSCLAHQLSSAGFVPCEAAKGCRSRRPGPGGVACGSSENSAFRIFNAPQQIGVAPVHPPLNLLVRFEFRWRALENPLSCVHFGTDIGRRHSRIRLSSNPTVRTRNQTRLCHAASATIHPAYF